VMNAEAYKKETVGVQSFTEKTPQCKKSTKNIQKNSKNK